VAAGRRAGDSIDPTARERRRAHAVPHRPASRTPGLQAALAPPVLAALVLSALLTGIAPRDGAAQPAVCPGDTEGMPGDTVAIPILVDNPFDIDAFGLSLTFEPDVLAFQSVETSLLTGGWAIVDGRLLEEGVVRVGGASGGDPIAISTPDTLCLVTMSVLAGPPSSPYTLSDFEDDLAGAPDCGGAFAATSPVEGSTWGGVKALYGRR
jgi:hypothetical protein